MSLNHQATRFSCSWPWSTLVLTCDGRVVCGCADPYAQRVLGDARTQSLGDIWTGDSVRTLRTDLNGGSSTFCGDCPLKLPLDTDNFIIWSICEEAAKRADGDILLMPLIPYGFETHHMDFTGTIDVKIEHLLNFVVRIADRHGA